MRKLIPLLLLVLTLAIALTGTSRKVFADGEPPSPHQGITKFEGPESCATCHLNAAQQVVDSLHYQQQGPAPYREGWDEEVLGGMYVTY